MGMRTLWGGRGHCTCWPGPHQAACSSTHSRLAEALAHRAPGLPARLEAALRLHWLSWQQETERARPSEDTVLLGQVGAQDFMTSMPPGLAAEREQGPAATRVPHCR